MKADIQKLFEERLNNKSEHKCVVNEDDYDIVKPKLEMIRRLAEVEGSVYAVYDLNRNNYILQSEEQKQIFGTANTGEEIDFSMHYDRIHPDDLAFVLETDNMLYQFYSELPANEKKDYKLIYDFRNLNTEGFYVRYIHQSVVLEQDRNSRTWLALVISHLYSDCEEYKEPQRRLINMKSGKLHLFNCDETSVSGDILTKREKEILTLISRGYDSVNIADKLSISINTVNNHRQNILRKTKSGNATQAVLYCKRLGVIS